MLVTSVLSILVLTPVILSSPLLERGTADSFSSAVGGDVVATTSLASATASSSSAISGRSTFPLLSSPYGSVQTIPVVQHVQTVQYLPFVQNYQHGTGYDRGYAGSVGGVIGGGFGRFRETYTIRARGFGGGLGGFGGGRFKAHYSSRGVAAGGSAGLAGGVMGGGGVGLLA